MRSSIIWFKWPRRKVLEDRVVDLLKQKVREK